MEKKEFNQQEYIDVYNKETYDRINFRIRKEDTQQLLELAIKNGHKTIASYSKALLMEQMNKPK